MGLSGGGAKGLAVVAALAAALAAAAPAGAEPVHWMDAPNRAKPKILAASSDGSIWFTEYARSAIGRVLPDGTTKEYADGIDAVASPAGITQGSDGNMWFAEPGTDSIGTITPDGDVTEYPLGPPHTKRPTAITEGPDGALWFTEPDSGQIGRITTDGDISQFDLEGEAPGFQRPDPLGIVAGGDGRLWFTNDSVPASVDALSPDGDLDRYHLPDGAPLAGIAPASDGGVLVTAQKIVDGTSKGAVYAVAPTGGVTQQGDDLTGADLMTADGGGGFWVTEKHNVLGRVDADGTTELDGGLPWIDSLDPDEQRKLDLEGITTAPDGGVWIGNPVGERIGRLDPAEPPGPADLSPPDIDIRTPSNLQEVRQGSLLLSDYACTDNNSGVRSCGSESAVTPVDPDLLSCATVTSEDGFDPGPLDGFPGNPLDTAEPGQHTFLVKAYDHAGHISCQRRFYEVDAPAQTEPPPLHPGAGGPAPPTRAAMGASLHRSLRVAAKGLRKHGLRRLQHKHVTAGTAKALTKGGLTATLTRRAHGHTTVLAHYHRAFVKKGSRRLLLTTTKAGRWLARRTAKRHGRLKVTVAVRFKPSGAKALTRHARVTLKR